MKKSIFLRVVALVLGLVCCPVTFAGLCIWGGSVTFGGVCLLLTGCFVVPVALLLWAMDE
jgi:hypothetical protein